jgi:hypothetical protein
MAIEIEGYTMTDAERAMVEWGEQYEEVCSKCGLQIKNCDLRGPAPYQHPYCWVAKMPAPAPPGWTDEQIRAAFIMKYNCGGFGDFEKATPGFSDATSAQVAAAEAMEAAVVDFMDYLMQTRPWPVKGPSTGMTEEDRKRALAIVTAPDVGEQARDDFDLMAAKK